MKKPASETMGYVNATGLGKLFTPPLTAATVNKLLEEHGYHVKEADDVWRATDKGQSVSVFVKMGPVGGFNKWSPEVASILKGTPSADRHAYVEPEKSAPAPAKRTKSKLGAFAKKKMA